MLSTELDEHVELMDRVIVSHDSAVSASLSEKILVASDSSQHFSRRRRRPSQMRERVLKTLTGKLVELRPSRSRSSCSSRTNCAIELGRPSSWPTTLADFSPFALAAIATTPAVLSGGRGT